MEINKDFYSDLPGIACSMLDRLITQYKDQPWFEKAWNEYRRHVESSDRDTVRMPGFVFNKYTKEMGHSISISDLSNFIMADSDELYHHGILGMKWGVRRYQNPDGSLTAEGKLRYKVDPKTGKYKKLNYQERKQALAKREAEKKAEAAKRNKSPREKKITELTDKQLDKYINRMQKEERAVQLRNSVNKLDPKPISRGEKFMSMLMDDVIIPAVRDAGKEYLTKLLKSAIKTENNKNKNNGGGNGKLSDNQKKRAKEMRDQGKSYEEIAKGFQGIDAETIKNYLNSIK